jgi:hypothetical protein
MCFANQPDVLNTCEQVGIGQDNAVDSVLFLLMEITAKVKKITLYDEKTTF